MILLNKSTQLKGCLLIYSHFPVPELLDIWKSFIVFLHITASGLAMCCMYLHQPANETWMWAVCLSATPYLHCTPKLCDVGRWKDAVRERGVYRDADARGECIVGKLFEITGYKDNHFWNKIKTFLHIWQHFLNFKLVKLSIDKKDLIESFVKGSMEENDVFRHFET